MVLAPENFTPSTRGAMPSCSKAIEIECWRRFVGEATIASMPCPTEISSSARTGPVVFSESRSDDRVQASDADAVAQARELFCEYATEAQLDLAS